jgi:hypothetical protein
MDSPDPRLDRIEAFNHRLDTDLDPTAANFADPSDPFLPADQEALALARRLAALNPSRESRLRYPLRRRLLGQAAAHARRSTRGNEGLHLLPSFRMRPAAGLSMSLALIFLFAWVFAGLSLAGGGSPVTPTAYRIPETAAGLGAPLPPETDTLTAGLSPQPIPTPGATLAHISETTATQGIGFPRQTPALTGQHSLPYSASPVTP